MGSIRRFTWRPWHSVSCNHTAQALIVLQALLVARHLGPGGRGELGLVQWAPPLLTVLAGFGLTQAMVAKVAASPNEGLAVFWTSYRIAGGLSVAIAFVAGLAYIATGWPSPQLLPITLLYVVITPLEIAHSFPREYMIAVHEFARYDLLKLFLGFLSFAGVIILVLFNAVSPTAVALVLIAAALVQVAASWRVAGRILWPPGACSRVEVDFSALLKFGGICMVSGFAGVMQARVFQYSIGTRHSVEALGVFLVATTWGGLGTPVWQAAQVRLYPAIAKAHGEGKGPKAFRRVVLVGAGVCTVAAIGGSAVTPWLFPLLLGREFAGSVTLAVLLALAMPLQSYATLLGFGLRALARPTQALWVDYLSAGGAVVLAVVLSFFATSLTVYAWAIIASGVIAIGLASWLGLRGDSQANG